MTSDKKKLYKKVLMLAIPMMVQNGISNAVSLVDNLMVGKLGTESMTAVSIAVQLIFVFNLAIFGGLSGPGIYGAQYYGYGNTDGVRKVFRLKLWIVSVIAVVGMGIFLLFGPNLVGLYLHGSASGIDAAKTLNLSLEYLHVMLIGFIPFAVTQRFAGSLRETGDSFKPMVSGIVAVITDVIFNYLLIYGKFGFPRLEVKGAAIATLLARFVDMAILVSWALAKKQKHTFLQGAFATLRVPAEFAGKIIKRGLPIFFNEFLWSAGLAALTTCYSLRGLEVVAGLNISNAIVNLLNVVFIALGNGVGIIIGQMLGASKYKEAQDNAFGLMWFSGAACLSLTFILVLLAGVFPKAYDTTEVVRNYGKAFILISAVFFPVQGCLNSLYFTLRAGGKTMITFLFDSVYSWTIAVPVAFLLVKLTTLPILVVYVVIQTLDVFKTLLGAVLIKKGIWLSNLAEE